MPTILKVEGLCCPSLSAGVLYVSDRWAGGEAVTMSEGPGGRELQALWDRAEPRGQVMLLTTPPPALCQPLISILGPGPVLPFPIHLPPKA